MEVEEVVEGVTRRPRTIQGRVHRVMLLGTMETRSMRSLKSSTRCALLDTTANMLSDNYTAGPEHCPRRRVGALHQGSADRAAGDIPCHWF